MKYSPYAFFLVVGSIIGTWSDNTVNDNFLRVGSSTRLIIIVDEVVISSFSGIASVACSPIVKDVIAYVYLFIVGRVAITTSA